MSTLFLIFALTDFPSFQQSLGPLEPGTVLIAVTTCQNAVCAQPDAWGPGTVLYDGAFNPQPNASAPQKGHYQDFVLPLQLQPGGAIVQVAHQFKEGGVSTFQAKFEWKRADGAAQATLQDVFDYSYVQFTVQ